MNEADSSDQPTVPTPLEAAAIPAVELIAAEAPQAVAGEDWQTVDFPGAMSVDAIPHTGNASSVVEAWNPDGCNQTQALNEAVAKGVIHYSHAEISPTVTYSAAFPLETAHSAMQQLQQENAALRDRLVKVEQALLQQLEGQLATTGSNGEAKLTSERFQPLLQELERSHQIAQRQQSLVETLTEQLNRSKERIAQLERDCALTQQRHNEQVQHVLQAESDSRDLRLRLHRQQQQTLQFKAALEKCLEMPTVYGNAVPPDLAMVSDPALPAVPTDLLAKNPPVKPWSLPSRISSEPTEPADAPKLLFKLLKHGSLEQGDTQGSVAESAHESTQGHHVLDVTPAVPFSDRPLADAALSTEPSALLDADDPQFVTHLMQIIFPAADQASLAPDALQAEPLLTLNAVADAEPSEATQLPAIDAVSSVAFAALDRPSSWTSTSLETAVKPDQQNTESVAADAIASVPTASLTDDPASDRAWEGLGTLIVPVLHADAAKSIEADVVNHSHGAFKAEQPSLAPSNATPPDHRPLPAVSTRAIPPFFAAAALPSAVSSAPTPTAQTAWTWRDRLVNAGAVARAMEREPVASPVPQLALNVAERQVEQQSEESSRPIAPTSTAVVATPSPLVYPERSSKKLASLAAVDLPTFPKQ